MAPDVGSSGLDLDALNQALGNAKLHLDQAVSQLGGDIPASRLNRLADTNTSCTNTSCGGASPLEAAPPVDVTRPV